MRLVPAGYCVKNLDDYGVPVITPGGGLGAHLDAGEFVRHLPQEQYPAGKGRKDAFAAHALGLYNDIKGDDDEEYLVTFFVFKILLAVPLPMIFLEF